MASRLKVIREKKGGIDQVRLAGVIDEHTDLAAEIGTLPSPVNIVCREIVMIQAAGVKAWIEFFQAQSSAGVRLAFTECPPAVVEQLNYINHFTAGGRVISISVPFTCSNCGKELRGTIKTEDLKRVSYRLPPIKCVRCGGQARFESAPEVYFAFLIRRG